MREQKITWYTAKEAQPLHDGRVLVRITRAGIDTPTLRFGRYNRLTEKWLIENAEKPTVIEWADLPQ